MCVGGVGKNEGLEPLGWGVHRSKKISSSVEVFLRVLFLLPARVISHCGLLEFNASPIIEWSSRVIRESLIGNISLHLLSLPTLE